MDTRFQTAPNSAGLRHCLATIPSTSSPPNSEWFQSALCYGDKMLYWFNFRFLPERWLRSEQEQPHPFTVLPFSHGPRMCIGKRFAELEVQMMVCKLLQRYRIEWVGDGKLGMTWRLFHVPNQELKFKFHELWKGLNLNGCKFTDPRTSHWETCFSFFVISNIDIVKYDICSKRSKIILFRFHTYFLRYDWAYDKKKSRWKPSLTTTSPLGIHKRSKTSVQRSWQKNNDSHVVLGLNSKILFYSKARRHFRLSKFFKLVRTVFVILVIFVNLLLTLELLLVH